MVGGEDHQPGRQAGFLGVGLRHDQGASGRAGGQCGRQHALHRPYCAGKRQFAETFAVGQAFHRQLSAGGEDAERNGQVEAAAVLGMKENAI